MSRLVLVACAALCAFMGSCAPKPPIGDEKCGYIDWFATTKGQVQGAAEAHCARYGKTGRVTKTEADKSGGHAFFQCE